MLSAGIVDSKKYLKGKEQNLFSKIFTGQNLQLVQITFPRKLIFQQLLWAAFTFGRNYHSLKAYFPEFSLARIYIWPKLRFPTNLFSRIYACQNLLLAEITFL